MFEVGILRNAMFLPQCEEQELPLYELCILISKIILLLARSSVLIHMPLIVSTFILQRPTPNLKESHGHPRTHFCKLNALIPSPNENVMSYLDTIFNILESDDTIANFLVRSCGFSRRKKVLQDLDYPFTEWCAEVFEDEMRIRFADGPLAGIGKIMT